MDHRWRDRAACKGAPEADKFHSTHNQKAADRYADEQLVIEKYCDHCPVRVECLQYAIDTRQWTGVWGGLGEDYFRAGKKSRAKARRIESLLMGSE